MALVLFLFGLEKCTSTFELVPIVPREQVVNLGALRTVTAAPFLFPQLLTLPPMYC